ncbi:phytolongin Phyl1.1-like [Canna indica]|uniref:Phytolongin Phyl1.1-like n=1 Tax=Canna indica TaxID=4628 RepID=A0AAQ3K5F6_9LILI|nr:phytolongin Phyl1.1-like [Canna indica]
MTVPMESSHSPGNIVFFGIVKEKDLVYSYNGGGNDLRALAQNWLEKAKCHHAWHSHSEENMTYGYLMQDGYTYFAIDDDACAGNSEMLSFLKRLREAYKNASKKDKVGDEELHWVVRFRAGEKPANACLKTRLLGSKNGGKKAKDVGGGEDRVLKIDGLQVPAGGVISLSRSLSSRLMAQQRGRRVWWRQVKILAAVDVLVCLIMFAIWLVVCEGFQCVS